MYKIFYPAGNGKWHTSDKITGVATCGNFVVEQDNDRSIHVQGNSSDKPHPLLCRRCLAKK
jgi:hypothetical protein